MRLPNKYGSVSKLNGKRRRPWIARITTGYETDFDLHRTKQIRQTIGYYATKKEAIEALAIYNDNPYNKETDRITFRDCYKEAEKEFSPARAYNYRSAFRYLEPIADMPIRSIKAAQMQQCIDSCKTTQQREIKTVCRKVFTYALQQEFIDRNPADYLKSNTVPPTIDRNVFTAEQIEDMWNKTDLWSKVALVLLYSGMRTKELLDLTPEQIDLENGFIDIRAAKNKSSIRKVPIHDRVFSILREFKASGIKFSHNGLNKALMREYGRHAHDCRHTFTTRMRECGCDLLTLQIILGHTPQTITEKIYTHISEKELKDAVNALDYDSV